MPINLSKSPQIQCLIQRILSKPKQRRESATNTTTNRLLSRRLLLRQLRYMRRTLPWRPRPHIFHPDPLVYLGRIEAHNIPLMNNLITDEYNILQVIKYNLPSIRPLCNHQQHFPDQIDNLLHQYKIFILGHNQIYL